MTERCWPNPFPPRGNVASVLPDALPVRPSRRLFHRGGGDSAGLELSRGPELRGVQTGLSSVFGQLGPRPVGDDVYTTLDPKAQRVAVAGLAGRVGSVVALDPRTGAVKVMYSNPSYNDNDPHATGRKLLELQPRDPGRIPARFDIQGRHGRGGARQSQVHAELDSQRQLAQDHRRRPSANDNNQSFGDIDLTTALTYSVNTVWAQVAEAIGRVTMTNYMQRFGFYTKTSARLPAATRST